METRKFIIPIQSEEQVKKINDEFKSNFKHTQEHVDMALDTLLEMIHAVGDKGGWYSGDSFEIEIKVKYCPEDK